MTVKWRLLDFFMEICSVLMFIHRKYWKYANSRSYILNLEVLSLQYFGVGGECCNHLLLSHEKVDENERLEKYRKDGTFKKCSTNVSNHLIVS